MLDFSNNKISQLCNIENFLKTVSEISLFDNVVSRVCEDTIVYMRNGSITYLNLANNNITKLPSKITGLNNLQQIELSGNKFVCDCDMTWMIDWFGKTTANGKRIVRDYDHVFCHGGKMIGKQIYKLTPDEMGCYPHVLSLAEKLTIGILGTLIIIIVISIIAVGRRWNEVKWLLYLHFNILDRSDRNEDITGKKYDAFISYR